MYTVYVCIEGGKDSVATKEKSGHAGTRGSELSQQIGFVDPKQLIHEIKSSRLGYPWQ
jgi:hypothetical protein